MAANTLPALLLALPAALLASATADAREPRVLDWADLVPEEVRVPRPMLPGADAPASSNPFDEQLDEDAPWISLYNFAVNEELDGAFVRIPGFIVPLESDEGGWLDEFLLVPYYGACIHVPPPPPNQLVWVKLDEPFYLRSMWDPFWVTGKMTTRRAFVADIAEAHYVMSGEKMELFEW
ncbi:MAG: DUF3299 domain-containing protein [Chromatiales bacterium]|nr:DUF3299 domain-containing protein [Chromatiales bacterium]